MTGRRLSICYAAPGQNLVPWAGPTRNVLSVAAAMSEWADVTVAFRRIPERVDAAPWRAVAIEPGVPPAAADDNATRGLHPLRHLSYCRTVWSFARGCAGTFDVVLEKGWRLSGLLSAACGRAGVPAVLVENDVRFWTERLDSPGQLAKYALHGLAHALAAAASRRAPAIIAETDELKALLVEHRRVPAGRVHVAGLGVDHTLFRPMDRAAAREALGIRGRATVLLYVGAMDQYHDLEPVIDALGRARGDVELHVVGDGEYRSRCEARARQAGARCRFHGRVPHEAVPRYIAAADLCLAPYRTSAFRGGRMVFSTLKIPEYMACARPVVSVPAPGPCRLVTDGVSGFVLPNEAAAWDALLRDLPSRERLAAMGEAAAAAAAHVTWAATAAAYLEVCERVLPGASQGLTGAALARNSAATLHQQH